MKANPPNSATTVILVRPEANGGLEVFMTRRPAGMNVLGGMYLFPGGNVRKEDYSEAMLGRCFGLSREAAQKNLGGRLTAEISLGHWLAGIRELFEETGVLLCVTDAGKPLNMNDPERRDRIAQKHSSLVAASIDFQTFLESESLFCDARRLAYFSHWLTPEEVRTRFDTRFFLARLPADQSPFSTSYEVSHSVWIAPERSLELFHEGKLPMIFPTLASLRTLADYDSLQALLAEHRLE